MNTRDQPVILIMTWLPHHFVLLFYPSTSTLSFYPGDCERGRERKFVFLRWKCLFVLYDQWWWKMVTVESAFIPCLFILIAKGITVLAWLLAWFLSSSLLMCISCAWIPLIWRNRHRYRVRQTSKVPIKASHRTTITKPLQLHDDHDHLDLFLPLVLLSLYYIFGVVIKSALMSSSFLFPP